MAQAEQINAALERAYSFLAQSLPNNRLYPTYIAPARQMCRLDLQVTELFSTALIAEALPKADPLRRKILDNFFLIAKQGTLFTFFTAPIYPPDTDTNSLIFSLLLEEGYAVERTARKLLGLIRKYMTAEKVVQVWLSESRLPQTDPIVSINAEILAIRLGQAPLSQRNRTFILNHLKTENYWNGTRYYHSPDAFLYFLIRLAKNDNAFAKQVFPLVQKAVYQRREATCYPLDLAQRLIALHWAGLDYGFELKNLLYLQRQDGSLPADAAFHFGARRGYFGSSFLSTAYFIKALQTLKNHKP